MLRPNSDDPRVAEANAAIALGAVLVPPTGAVVSIEDAQENVGWLGRVVAPVVSDSGVLLGMVIEIAARNTFVDLGSGRTLHVCWLPDEAPPVAAWRGASGQLR